MPTPLAHAFLVWPLVEAASRGRAKPSFVIFAALSAVLPDIDLLAYVFNVNESEFFGHRGFTHSVVFAFLAAAAIAFFYARKKSGWLKAFLVFLAASLSHSFFDALSDTAVGVAFFLPFFEVRLLFSWRPIAGSLKTLHDAGLFEIITAPLVLFETFRLILPAAAIALSFRFFALWKTKRFYKNFSPEPAMFQEEKRKI